MNHGDPPSPDGFGGASEWEDVFIKDINEGDEVLTFDEKTGTFIPSIVEKLLVKGKQTVYELLTETGKSIKTTAEHPYLVKQTAKNGKFFGLDYAFVDEVGVSYSHDQPLFGIGAFVINDTIEINKELHDVLTEALSYYHKNVSQPGRFEFKFNAIKKNNVQFYRKILAILEKYDWNFWYIIEDKPFFYEDLPHNYIWERYTSLLTRISANFERDTAIVADYFDEPSSSKSDLRDIRNVANVCNIMQSESHGSLLLQVVDILVGAINFTGKFALSPDLSVHREKKEIAEAVIKILVAQKKRGYKLSSCLSSSDCINDEGPCQEENNLSTQIDADWIKVKNLKPGQKIVTIDGFETIKSINKLGREEVFDIQIANTHNFVGNGIVAHNTTTSPSSVPPAGGTTADKRGRILGILGLGFLINTACQNETLAQTLVCQELGLGQIVGAEGPGGSAWIMEPSEIPLKEEYRREKEKLKSKSCAPGDFWVLPSQRGILTCIDNGRYEGECLPGQSIVSGYDGMPYNCVNYYWEVGNMADDVRDWYEDEKKEIEDRQMDLHNKFNISFGPTPVQWSFSQLDKIESALQKIKNKNLYDGLTINGKIMAEIPSFNQYSGGVVVAGRIDTAGGKSIHVYPPFSGVGDTVVHEMLHVEDFSFHVNKYSEEMIKSIYRGSYSRYYQDLVRHSGFNVVEEKSLNDEQLIFFTKIDRAMVEEKILEDVDVWFPKGTESTAEFFAYAGTEYFRDPEGFIAKYPPLGAYYKQLFGF